MTLQTDGTRHSRMRLYLINPVNPLALAEVRQGWFNRYRVWKPLGLLTLAALTPDDWEITILDGDHRLHVAGDPSIRLGRSVPDYGCAGRDGRHSCQHVP